jgi:hypothetical protein
MLITKSSFSIFPTYPEIFKNGQEEIIANLSQDGLAEKFIVFTTSISTLLYASHIKGDYVQEEIMMEFKEAIFGTEDGIKIHGWLLSHNQKTLNFNNFTLMELYRMLFKYKNGPCDNLSLSVSEQLLYLKLILIANERRIHSIDNIQKVIDSITPNDVFAYEKLFWPILLQETDVNEVLCIEYEMFRIKSFVEGIVNRYPNAESIVTDFFKERGFDSYRTYASSLTIFFLDYITSYTNDGILKAGIKGNDLSQSLFAPLTANSIIPDTYLDLKSHPVYYYNGDYYVIHWNYLLSQIFIGVFMALKNKLNESGIQGIKKDCGIIIEHTLFKKVLMTAFSNSWQCSAFDDGNKGIPDAIFKIGNNLFILELKDNLMGEDVMESFDYAIIENHMNRNFIQSNKGKKKAIKQLDANIRTYTNNGYKGFGFPYNKKLNIYPIIIYTDYKYRLNGLNHYLSIKFNEIVKPKEESINRRIRPLTVIGLDCLFNMQYKFKEKKIKFADVLDDYHKNVKINEKKNVKRGVEKHSQLYPSFDRYLPENRSFFMSYSEAQTVIKDFLS